ncbi:MAG: LEA type 2 family protein [Candidatus Bathyarchaeia archaeon]
MKSKVLVLLVLLVAGFPVGLYGYGYVKTAEVLNKSLETMDVTSFKVLDVSLLPPTAEVEVMLTIENPTDTSITLKSVYFEVFLEDVKLGEVVTVGKPLPSKGVATLEGVMRIRASVILTAIRDYMERGSITLRITGSVTASATYLFVTVSRDASVNLTREYKRY